MAKTSPLKSERGKLRRVIVVGSGVAGLSTTLALCEAGVAVLLISLGPSSRAASACLQSGMSAALGLDGSGDSPQNHFEESVEAGRFLANQPPVQAMTRAAPGILERLQRMGVPFERTTEGRVAQGGSDGTAAQRTAYAGSTTGLHVVSALSEQVRRWEAKDVVDEHGVEVPGETMVHRLEGWEVVQVVLDDNGVAVGVAAQELRTLRIKAHAGDAVCLATGGVGHVFSRSTAGTRQTGTAALAAHRQGAAMANMDLLHVHPTAFPAADKARAVGEKARALGGRIWLPREAADKRAGVEIPEKERDYILERRFAELGNLASGWDAATTLVEAFVDKGRGIADSDGAVQPLAYLDLTHLRRSELSRSLGPLLDSLARASGIDPYSQPIRVGPAPAGIHGGLWVDFEATESGELVEESPRNHATTIPGLYAAGDVEYGYEGGCRLEGDALLRLVHAGRMAAAGMAAYRSALARSALDLPSSVFDSAQNAADDEFSAMVSAGKTPDGDSVHSLHADLATAMCNDCGLRRDPATLDRLLEELVSLDDRASSAHFPDGSTSFNPCTQAARHLKGMVGIARVVAAAAKARLADETRRTILLVADEDGGSRIAPEVEYECAGRPLTASSAIDSRFFQPGGAS